MDSILITAITWRCCMDYRYKVVPDGQTFAISDKHVKNPICYTYWRCNADKVCAALNAFDGETKATVEDVDRRCIELLHGGDGERTFGAIWKQLISEFGEELFEQARQQKARQPEERR
jgi:hypothetical protein